jgi:hypothetical protein
VASATPKLAVTPASAARLWACSIAAGSRHHPYPAPDETGRIIRDYHRRITARVEHAIARLKDWQILRQCRRRGDAINHTLQIIAGLWNLKNHRPLRVNP